MIQANFVTVQSATACWVIYVILLPSNNGTCEIYLFCSRIDGSTARRCTAIVTNQRRARLRQSVKFLVSRVFKNTVGVVQSSADITAK